LIEAIPSMLGVSDLTAETDTEAVGFYRALGFTATSLGEKYLGVERFACSFRWRERTEGWTSR
jgi:ribosomal protein S18 acetylase RimI-like enzyme